MTAFGSLSNMGPEGAGVRVRSARIDPCGVAEVNTVAQTDAVTVRHDRFPLPFEDVTGS